MKLDSNAIPMAKEIIDGSKVINQAKSKNLLEAELLGRSVL